MFTDNYILLKQYNPLKIYSYNNIESVPININKTNLYKYQMKIEPCIYERNWKTKMIWNSKMYFMNKTVKDFNSLVYIWIDIGCMRYEQNYSNFPDVKKIHKLSSNNEMHFFVTRKIKFEPYKIYSYKCLYIIATSFFGSKLALKRFITKFYKILYFNLENRIYFGTEQNLMDMTLYKYFPSADIYPLYKSLCLEKSVFWKFLSFYSDYDCSQYIHSFKYKNNIDNLTKENNIKCGC